MRVLICTASRHEATTGIGDAIALQLRRAGHEVVHVAPEVIESLEGYDAVVLGSAVYVGHWLHAATAFAERFSEALRQRPVWLFSSGPLGDLSKPTPEPADLPGVLAATGAREHRVFAGRLDRSRLGVGERVVVAVVHAPDGDQRPWATIMAWGDTIAADLAQSVRPSLSLAT